MHKQNFGFAVLMTAGLLSTTNSFVGAQAPAGNPNGRQTPAPAPTGSTYTTIDFNFTQDAAQANAAEIQAAKLALGSAGTAQLKEIAQRMIDEHTVANERLQGLADGKRILLPNTPNQKDADTIARIAKLSDVTFDGEYKRFLLSSHLQAEKIYKKEIKSGKDPDLKAFAKTTLVTIEAHLKEMRALGKQSTTTMPARTGSK